MVSSIGLLKTKRFLPLFLTQFFGALNDNIFKNALVIYIAYSGIVNAESSEMMVTMVALLFILPFFLFSALAGQVADKYDRAKIARIVKVIEIFIMVVASVAFHLQNVYLLYLALFLMGSQSAFFGPVKYAIIPQLMSKDEVVAANGLISGATFIAILVGTIVGGLLILVEDGIFIIAVLTIIAAILGFIMSCSIPAAHSKANINIDYNIFRQTSRIVAIARQKREVFLAIIGVAWFWFIGATFLAQFPNYVSNILFANNEVVTLFLTIFSLAIAIGSVICNKLLKGQASAIFAPISLLFVSIFTIDLYFATAAYQPLIAKVGFLGLDGFLASLGSNRIIVDLFFIALFCGIYVVPLYSIIQLFSNNAIRSRIIAALNILDSSFMVIAACVAILLLTLGFTTIDIFLVMAIINFIAVAIVCKLLPGSFTKSIFRIILGFLFRVEVKNIENYSKKKGNKIIIANHTSFLDAIVLAAFLPDGFSFAVNTEIAKRWYFKPFLALVDSFAIDPTNPMSVKSMINLVKEGKKLVIFPEGRITVTSALMKIYAGPAVIAQKSDATIIPVRIDGAQYSKLSRLKGKVRTRYFPKITLDVMKEVKLEVDPNLSAAENRQMLAARLSDVMTDLVFETSNYRRTLFDSLIDAAKTHGFNHKVSEDVNFKALNYRQLITKSFALGSAIAKVSKPKELLGVLMPNANSNAVLFFALQSHLRIPVMMNYSTGIANLISSAKTSKMKTIISSRRFIELAKLEEAVSALLKSGFNVVYLEDFAVNNITIFDKLKGLVAGFFPKHAYNLVNGKGNIDHKQACAVLFTSGSSGAPKGVMLSHENIQANRFQMSSKIDFSKNDIIFNALPMFHSFGLTAGTILPILSGVKVFFYPSPLHYKVIPEIVYSINATILFATNTFLNGYARFAHNYDFYSLRYVFAGAEKVYEETRSIWAEKFGIRILEGYGATETSPILSVNTAMEYKKGSVGRILPGITTILEEIEGINDGKKLIVKGPNVMLGYLLAEQPGKLQEVDNATYDTGDIVDIDDEGYIFIKGRAKRFAKIAGEMVSLGAIEVALQKLWPDFDSAVTTLPDSKKGEQIILVTTNKKGEKSEIVKYFKENNLPDIATPKTILVVDKLPLLGTGKIDYVGLNEVAKADI